MTAKRMCYYVSPTQDPDEHGGYVPSVVYEGQPGHCPLVGDPDKHQAPYIWGQTLEQAEETADRANTRMGLTQADVFGIIGSSIGV